MTIFCPQCGNKQTNEAMRFCSRCGFSLEFIADLMADNEKLVLREQREVAGFRWMMATLLLMLNSPREQFTAEARRIAEG